MDGSPSNIEIFKPFGEAFELTKKILFQPFDLTKWCVIGFAAFLANLGSGFNFNYNFKPRGNAQEQAELRNAFAWIHEIPRPILISGIVAAVVLLIIIMIVFLWLRARGRFMFIDCIVKNRGAIAEPWREFKTLGNSFFLFSLVVGFLFAGICAVLGLMIALPSIGRRGAHFHNDAVFIVTIVVGGTIMFLLIILWALIAQLAVPIMYRRRCRAMEAARSAVSLISDNPGEITLYCLFWIVLFLGAAVIGCLSTCATCCLTMLPYVGTVILLPVLMCLRAFSLFFVRQFGPDYDVWGTLPPPEPPPLQTEIVAPPAPAG